MERIETRGIYEKMAILQKKKKEQRKEKKNTRISYRS